MQTRGTFPELNAGLKSSKRANSTGRYRKADTGGYGGFKVSGKARRQPQNPKTLADRRAASHALAYKDSCD